MALALAGLSACDRTRLVAADATGTTRLPLQGDRERRGTLRVPLVYQGQRVEAGTEVIVFETWLLREEPGASPPGYRIAGLYDPTTRAEGLVLPAGSIDIYFVSSLPGDPARTLPVPKDALRLTP